MNKIPNISFKGILFFKDSGKYSLEVFKKDKAILP